MRCVLGLNGTIQYRLEVFVVESLSVYHFIILVGLLGVLAAACARRRMPQPAKTVVADASTIVGSDGTLREDLGIETLGGVFVVILPAGCAVPCQKCEVFSTAHDSQQSIDVSLYRGTGKAVKDCVLVGKYRIQEILESPRGQPQIRVYFEVSQDGVAIYAQDAQRKMNMAIREVE